MDAGHTRKTRYTYFAIDHFMLHSGTGTCYLLILNIVIEMSSNYITTGGLNECIICLCNSLAFARVCLCM